MKKTILLWKHNLCVLTQKIRSFMDQIHLRRYILPLSFAVVLLACYNDNIDRVIGNDLNDKEVLDIYPNKNSVIQLNDVFGLVQSTVDRMGGSEALITRKDVSFEFTTEEISTGKKDISLEKYIFSEDYSSGDYYVHNWKVFPEVDQSIHQRLYGSEIILFFNEKLILNRWEQLKAYETRLDNYFSFTLFFRLNDPQMILKNLGKRKVNNISYNLVKMNFKPEYQPENNTVYIFYINPRTLLIDQFLQSVPKEGILEPRILVKLEYNEIDNILIPVRKEFYHSDSKGESIGEMFANQTFSNIQFDNGFNLIN